LEKRVIRLQTGHLKIGIGAELAGLARSLEVLHLFDLPHFEVELTHMMPLSWTVTSPGLFTALVQKAP
jgi:hypothetical protein